MGRQLRHVPLDFDWPLNLVWKGYLPEWGAKDYDPPTGSGFQLWETTSEGSPISPVFETLEDLCAYAATHCSPFGSDRINKDQWLELLSQTGLVLYPLTTLGPKVFAV